MTSNQPDLPIPSKGQKIDRFLGEGKFKEWQNLQLEAKIEEDKLLQFISNISSSYGGMDWWFYASEQLHKDLNLLIAIKIYYYKGMEVIGNGIDNQTIKLKMDLLREMYLLSLNVVKFNVRVLTSAYAKIMIPLATMPLMAISKSAEFLGKELAELETRLISAESKVRDGNIKKGLNQLIAMIHIAQPELRLVIALPGFVMQLTAEIVLGPGKKAEEEAASISIHSIGAFGHHLNTIKSLGIETINVAMLFVGFALDSKEINRGIDLVTQIKERINNVKKYYNQLDNILKLHGTKITRWLEDYKILCQSQKDDQEQANSCRYLLEKKLREFKDDIYHPPPIWY